MNELDTLLGLISEAVKELPEDTRKFIAELLEAPGDVQFTLKRYPGPQIVLFANGRRVCRVKMPEGQSA